MGQTVAISAFCLTFCGTEINKIKFLLYGQDPRLPTETILEQTHLEDAEDYWTELLKLALENIKQARIMTSIRVSISWRSCDGLHARDRKLARQYHGPFRIVNLTSTNAEVQLIEDQSISVAIDRPTIQCELDVT